MQIFFIISNVISERNLGIGIQVLYTAREFQKKLGDNFLFVPRRVHGEARNELSGINYTENSSPILRARVFYYLIWLPFFMISRGWRRKDRIVYCVDWHVAIPAILCKKIFGYKVAMEYHDPPPGSWRDEILVRFCDYLLPTTCAMGDYMKSIRASADKKICVSPNGVDIDKFSNVPSKYECRKRLGLPLNKKIILYSGNFPARKGILVVVDAISLVSDENILYVFAGGTNMDDVRIFKEKIRDKKNAIFAGYKHHSEIPYWIGAADAVVAPYSADASTIQGAAAIKWASPMKILEYMAAKRPIVASNIPSVTQFLNEGNALLVEPDSPRSLAEGIMKCLRQGVESEKRTEQAFKDVQNYTWENRVNKIMEFFQK
jgi:glycosyltransferase involved in cell wall biosynthesis